MDRRLAAILVGDVVGFTRLMEADEEATAERLKQCLAAAQRHIAENDGRVFKTMGDAVLAEFASPVRALRAAVRIREDLALAERGRTEPLLMRFGLHLADVMVDGDDLLGDGVNLAARIQQAAEPGAIDVSGSLFDNIRRVSPYAFEPLGECVFKNIAEPISVYRVKGEIERHIYQITPTRSAPVTAKRPHSLAVLPFEVQGDEADQHYLAEGLSEELIFELGRFHRLFVTSRSATRALEGQATDPQTAGERLGVRYVLTGSIRPLGRAMRLTLTLSETEGGSVIWTDRLNSAFDELIDGLDMLAARIAATVLGRIEDADIATARRMKTESMTAYECHLRGLEYHRLGGITDDNMREAMKWFARAIEADPHFARPHAMLTCAWASLPDFDLLRGISHVERALELDPNDPEANRIMGAAKMQSHEFEAARQYHEKALSLSPSDAYLKGRCAAFYIFVGEPDRALQLLDEAEELDPFLPVWCVEERTAAYYAMGRFEEAIRAARALPFQTRRSRLYRAASRMALNEDDRALQIVAEALVSAPDLSTAYIEQFEFYRDPAIKRLLIERLERAGLPAAMTAAAAVS